MARGALLRALMRPQLAARELRRPQPRPGPMAQQQLQQQQQQQQQQRRLASSLAVVVLRHGRLATRVHGGSAAGGSAGRRGGQRAAAVGGWRQLGSAGGAAAERREDGAEAQQVQARQGAALPKRQETSVTAKGKGAKGKKSKESESRVAWVATKGKELAVGTGNVIMQMVRNPLIVRQWARSGWVAIKDMASHTWTGFKLLGVEIRTSSQLVRKRLQGHQLTRRERRQLVRTTADLARVGPFLFFILVPFMEFLLPVALKLFPNMLPSTFQDSYKAEEDMKRKLKLRIEMASFLQDMVSEMENKAKHKSVSNETETDISIQDVQHFMGRVRMGANIDRDTVLRVAKLFSDELTTDNMSRSQLVLLCRYMGLPAYGGDQFLRFQLRQKINALRDDDSSIFFEGVESLNLLELKQACQDRGMRATGLTMHQLRTQLKRWIDLSVDKNVPLSLLILSRVFTLQTSEKDQVELAISEAISQMDADVLQEALVAGAENQNVAADQSTISRLKLEAIQAQNDMIEAEIAEKARKQEFLEKLRQRAQAELEAQQGTSAGEVSLAAVVETIESIEHKANQIAPNNSRSPETIIEAAREVKADIASSPGKEPAATPKLHAPERDGKLSELDEELKLEPNQPDMAEPLRPEDGTPEAEAGTSSKDSELEETLEEEENKELTETLESLKVLASDSSLEEEKIFLEEILDKQEAMDAANAVGSGRIIKSADEEEGVGVAAESFEPERRSRRLLKNKLRSMLDKLEVDMETIDEKIGQRLKILDLDKDGKVSSWELRHAIVTALKRREDYTDEKADRLIQRLDLDRDGIIDLEEVDKILQTLKEEQIRIDGE